MSDPMGRFFDLDDPQPLDAASPRLRQAIQIRARHLRRMRTVAVALPAGLVAAALAGVLVVTLPAHQPSVVPVSPTPTNPSTPTPSPDPTATPSTRATGAANLPVTTALLAQLRTAYLAENHLPPAQVVGPLQAGPQYEANFGSVRYTYIPATDTFWALAQFGPSSKATLATQVAFQDGANIGIFSHRPGQPWRQVSTAGAPFPCWQAPAEVLAAWGYTISTYCIQAEAYSPKQGTGTAFPSSIPDGTYFGPATIVTLYHGGTGDLYFDPVTWQSNAPPVDHSLTFYFLTFDPDVVAEHWVGTNQANSHLVRGRFDTAYTHLIQTNMTDSADPHYGIQLTVTNGKIRTIQIIGPLTPPPAHPNLTEPTS
jgi:hypothetical protein